MSDMSAAEGIKAMEEALREIAESRFGTPAWDLRAIAQRALSTWDTRGRLRDDEALRRIIMRSTAEYEATRCNNLGETLDAIERAVLGTPTRGKEGPT